MPTVKDLGLTAYLEKMDRAWEKNPLAITPDEQEQVKRCLSCVHIQMVSGVLSCALNKCRYQPSKGAK